MCCNFFLPDFIIILTPPLLSSIDTFMVIWDFGNFNSDLGFWFRSKWINSHSSPFYKQGSNVTKDWIQIWISQKNVIDYVYRKWLTKIDFCNNDNWFIRLQILSCSYNLKKSIYVNRKTVFPLKFISESQKSIAVY